MFTRSPAAEPRAPERGPTRQNGAHGAQPFTRAPSTGEKSVIGNDLKIIGQGLKIIGRGLLQVDGEIEGDVQAVEVIVGEKGKVTGMVAGEQVVVRGKVSGVICAKSVALQSSSSRARCSKDAVGVRPMRQPSTPWLKHAAPSDWVAIARTRADLQAARGTAVRSASLGAERELVGFDLFGGEPRARTVRRNGRGAQNRRACCSRQCRS